MANDKAAKTAGKTTGAKTAGKTVTAGTPKEKGSKNKPPQHPVLAEVIRDPANPTTGTLKLTLPVVTADGSVQGSNVQQIAVSGDALAQWDAAINGKAFNYRLARIRPAGKGRQKRKSDRQRPANNPFLTRVRDTFAPKVYAEVVKTMNNAEIGDLEVREASARKYLQGITGAKLPF